jgi:hypothetical protein
MYEHNRYGKNVAPRTTCSNKRRQPNGPPSPRSRPPILPAKHLPGTSSNPRCQIDLDLSGFQFSCEPPFTEDDVRLAKETPWNLKRKPARRV